MNKQVMLIVDDIEVNREALATCFCEQYTIIQKESGKSAIAYLEGNADRVAVILLDIMMPEITGIDFLKWISGTQYCHIPVVAITSEPEYQLEALKNGAWDFITKPTDPEIIIARVNNVIGRYALDQERKLNKALKKAKLEMDNLINSIPGGIAIYRLSDHFDTLYFSDGVAELSGHTRAEYAAYIEGDATKIIYAEDKTRITEAAITAAKSGYPIDVTYRICHKNGSLVWVRLNAVVIEENADGYLIHAVFQKPAKMAQLYDNLVNESQSAIYVSDVNNYDLLYINDTGMRFVGKKRQPYLGQKCYELLFDRSEPCDFCRIHSMSEDGFVERDFPYAYNDRIYRLRGKRTDWNGIDAHVEYIEDVTENRNALQKNEELLAQLSSVIEHVPGGLCLYRVDVNGIWPIVHNQAFFDIFGYSEENIKAIETNTNYLNVHPDDLKELQSKLEHAIQTSAPVNHTYRVFNDLKGDYIWVYLNAVVLDQMDHSKLCYVSYTDVTAERRNHGQLLEAQKSIETLQKQAEDALSKYRALINTVPGGIALYEVDGNKILTKYYSDGLCALSGYTREERDRICADNAMALTYCEDIPLLTSAIQNAVQNKSDLHLTYRLKTKSGLPHYVSLNATYLPVENGRPEFHAVFSDVDEVKKLEEVSKEQQLRYEVAIKSSGINIWEYDIQKDELTVISNSSRIKQNCFVIKDYIASTIKNGYVRQDSLDTFNSIFERLKRGVKEVSEDIWYKTTDEAGWWCERVIYTTVFGPNGEPLKAFGAGRDVTREKDAIKKFNEEMSYRAAVQASESISIKINLTQNTVIEGESPFRVLNELIAEGNADHYFTKTSDYIIGEKGKAEYRELFSCKSLLSRFNQGDYSVSMEFARVFDASRIYWMKYSVHLMKNPESQDVIAFVIATDITEKRVMETIMQTIVNTDYDFFVVVDGSRNSAMDYAVTDMQKRLFSENEAFENQLETLIRQHVCPEDIEWVVKECRIDNIISHIEKSEIYKFNYSMHEESGEIRRKQLQFTLISAERKTFLMTRIDVNEIFVEQKQAQERLENALENAQKAGAAKSEFLSRMSHDIRTPLNAVIGLSGLGVTSNSAEEMRNYLKQIGISGEYLLSIINDVLDMSKIENNRLELHPTAVFLPDFIRDVVSIVIPTIKAKQLDFELSQRGIQEHYIFLDRTYVKQVVVNLLSNAIKFTPEGGKIELCLENVSRRGNFVRNRMIISDSGIGIGKEFIPKVFTPFEQENVINDTARKGTGLGLSIVKSIVDLMGGSISVESEKGKGTTFTIEWEFRIASAKDLPADSHTASADETILENRRILLCEDHPLNTQIATKLLQNKGMLVECAQNGKIALDCFENSPQNYYDGILMDIRMPVIDGLATAKAIRALERPDAKTVPIIAMTANAFREDVKKSLDAGMNAHLSKPIEPQLLYQTLAEQLDHHGK